MNNNLQPSNLEEFIGQKKLVNTLEVIIASAQKQRRQVDHILFHGPPGLGKTTLSNIIGKMIGKRIRYAQGPMLDKKSDILTLFASITKHDVVFIDEIHAINKNVVELLYSIMEEKVIDIAVGPEGDAKIMRMHLPPFTLIGATTLFSKMPIPLKNRFGFIGKFNNYDEEEICNILKNSAEFMKIKISDLSIKTVASFSQMVPRIANNLLKRVRDFSVVEKQSISKQFIIDTFMKIGVYSKGLTESHVQYLKLLKENFANKWVALDTILGILHETKQNVETEIEPLLMKNNLIKKSSRGRLITPEGKEFLSGNIIK